MLLVAVAVAALLLGLLSLLLLEGWLWRALTLGLVGRRIVAASRGSVMASELLRCLLLLWMLLLVVETH
jgi:hypothetical protein